jgi:hypothetical protein
MAVEPGYRAMLAEVVRVVESARRASARAVNSLITATYWTIGRRIVEEEQHGEARAGYGEALLERLAVDLTARFGRGFGRRNLFQMRAFCQPPCAKPPSGSSSGPPGACMTPSRVRNAFTTILGMLSSSTTNHTGPNRQAQRRRHGPPDKPLEALSPARSS